MRRSRKPYSADGRNGAGNRGGYRPRKPIGNRRNQGPNLKGVVYKASANAKMVTTEAGMDLGHYLADNLRNGRCAPCGAYLIGAR